MLENYIITPLLIIASIMCAIGAVVGFKKVFKKKTSKRQKVAGWIILIAALAAYCVISIVTLLPIVIH